MRERRGDQASIDYRKGTRASRSRCGEESIRQGKRGSAGAPDRGARRRGRSRRSSLADVGAAPRSRHVRFIASFAGPSRATAARVSPRLPVRDGAGGAAAAPSGSALAPQLAGVYAGQVDPALCFVSEKYDGVRALWDGDVLRHRSGRRVSAPASFLAALPAQPLDGELWLGRGRFDQLSAIVRRAEPRVSEWREVRYMVFDMPVGGASFEARLDRLAALVRGRRAVELAPQRRVADRAELERRSTRRRRRRRGPDAPPRRRRYPPGRSDALLKLKPHLDAEAVVVGHRGGAGKYRDRSARSRSSRRRAGASSSAAA